MLTCQFKTKDFKVIISISLVLAIISSRISNLLVNILAMPFQSIANLTTEIPTPNFQGYTSGHSVISMVASKVLGEIFPLEKKNLDNLVLQASLSRV